MALLLKFCEKVVSLVTQSHSGWSRLKHGEKRFRMFYLSSASFARLSPTPKLLGSSRPHSSKTCQQLRSFTKTNEFLKTQWTLWSLQIVGSITSRCSSNKLALSLFFLFGSSEDWTWENGRNLSDAEKCWVMIPYPARIQFSFRLFFRAKVQLENKKGHTALDVAKAYADPRVVAIVQKRWDEIPPPVDKKKRMYCMSKAVR